MLTKSTEKHSILTKGCVLLCLILLSFCPTPTDALPTHLSRRGDDVLGDSDPTTLTDFDGGIPGWVTDFFGTAAAGIGAVGTAVVGASQLDSNRGWTVSPESGQGEQALPGAEVPEMTSRQKVPESQPPEDSSFYGTPKPVPDPTPSDVKLPPGNEQPDLGTVWMPKSKVQGQ